MPDEKEFNLLAQQRRPHTQAISFRMLSASSCFRSSFEWKETLTSDMVDATRELAHPTKPK